MDYHQSIEQLLARYCDEAQVREALHRTAYHHYKRKLTCMQLPIIILSAVSGSVQLLSKSFVDYESQIVTGTAFLSISVSIISACLSYLKLGELKSKHEVSQVAWQNFNNSLVHQLNLAPEFREDPVEYIHSVRTTYDRLFEISPILNRGFMREIRKRVMKTATDAFIIPPYLNGFHHARIWRGGGGCDDDNSTFQDNSVNEQERLREEVEIQLQEVQTPNNQSVPVRYSSPA